MIRAALLALLVAGSAFAAPRPNILYLYVDDMGWGSIGPNGQAERKANGLPHVLTPNLDRLAAAGVNFARCYGATVCSPARSSQQSGFHQGHTFADRNDPDNAKKAMRSNDILMGDALSEAGYVTGYWGKWGYGATKDMASPEIVNLQTLPTSHGYQHVVAELHHVRAHTFFQPTLWSAPASADAVGGLELRPNTMAPYKGNAAYPNSPALQNHSDYPTTAYCDDLYAFAALDFIRKQAQSRQPFFALLAAQIPHGPFGEVAKLPEWDAAYKDLPWFDTLDGQSKQWAAMVTRIDAHIGNLLNALEDPNGDGDRSDSVAENTLVIFQSDNGGPRHPANKTFDANGGLRGNKGSIYEGGIRVPTIVRWPAHINVDSTLKAGTTSDKVIDVTDLLPTFCELAGHSVPLGVDGASLAPTLLGQRHQRPREFLIHEAGSKASIIQGNHKLILSTQKKKQPGILLYDLDSDRAETTDISATHPDLAKKLKALLIGEHVTEPRGFANTYHRWTGSNGDSVSDPGNWSDYVYENAGITYLSDSGAPRTSWVAVMDTPTHAMVDATAEFLGLHITRGQEVTLTPGVTLSGRNEIRVSDAGLITLKGGTLSSLRWIDITSDGRLQGAGTIDADLYTEGTLDLSGKVPLRVTGAAHLGGTLRVSNVSEKSVTVLKAGRITGTFTHNKVDIDGRRFEIQYTDSAVTLTEI